MATNEGLPLPSSRSRAVAPDATGRRGARSEESRPAATSRNVAAVRLPQRDGARTRDLVAADPALELLRAKKTKRTGINVHILEAVNNSFMQFVNEFELPKGDTVSMAMQEFLERRGVTIPGVPRLIAEPEEETYDEDDTGDAAT